MKKRHLVFVGLFLFLSAACFVSAAAENNASASSIKNHSLAFAQAGDSLMRFRPGNIPVKQSKNVTRRGIVASY